MSLLAALKQKRESRQSANANPAKAANDGHGGGEPLAKLAPLALANPTDARTADAVTSWGWLLHFADREPLEVYCNPDATHGAILERYPDALAAEPTPERTKRTPTDAEAAELRALVQAVGNVEGWDTDLLEWATATALADPDNALICYREIVVEHGIILPLDDDRRTCGECANLNRRRCLAAWRGEIVANRDYEPVRDIPRRCEGYAPGADDPDTRSGLERWPHLMERG